MPIRLYTSFTDHEGTWLPHPEIKKYPWWRNLEKWFRRKYCVYLNGRLPKRRKLRVVSGGGNENRSRPTYVGAKRQFFLQSDLDLIDASISKLQHTVGQETVSWPEAKALGFTAFLFWSLAGEHPQKKERRIIERNGRKYQRKLSVVSLTKLNDRKNSKPADMPTARKPILPSEAVIRTNGEFTLEEMRYWETHRCPHLGRSLTITSRDMLREQEKNVRGEIRSIRYFRPHVKHYFVDEIDEAYKNFLAKRALRKSSIGVAVMDGRTIMTAGAIYREHGLSEQIIEKARDKGWLEAVRMRRRGSGRHDAAWWYFRKFAIVTGSGEWSGVTLLRRERGKLRTQYRVDRKH